MPTPSEKHRGWSFDRANSRLNALYNNTAIFRMTASALTFIKGATFDSTVATTGLVTAAGGLVSTSATQPVGYATGAGGAVTQITSAATAVTLDKPCGQITTVALTTAGAAEEAFVVNNSLVDANDVIVVNTTYAGAGKPIVFVTNVGAGVFTVNITNVDASSLNAVLVVNFAVIKGVVS